MMPFRDRQIVVHARAKYYWLCWLHYSNALFVTRPRQRAIFAAFSWSLRECGCAGARARGREGAVVGGGSARAGRGGREVGRGSRDAGARGGRGGGRGVELGARGGHGGTGLGARGGTRGARRGRGAEGGTHEARAADRAISGEQMRVCNISRPLWGPREGCGRAACAGSFVWPGEMPAMSFKATATMLQTRICSPQTGRFAAHACAHACVCAYPAPEQARRGPQSRIPARTRSNDPASTSATPPS